MKTVRYFWTENGKLVPIDKNDKLIQQIKWQRNETLKIEIWPFDLKIGPTKQIPYETKRQTSRERINEIIEINRKHREEKEARPNQEPLIRFNETSTPYSQQFTKRDDARNRAHLSKELPKRRKGGEESPSQTETPF